MAEFDPSPDVKELAGKSDETDPALKAKTRVAELVAPSESVAKEIQDLAQKGGQELLKKHPHPEMKRIVEHATGVFLWEQMARPQNSESMLPPGLVARLDENNTIDTLAFDGEHLHRSEYVYVLDFLKKQGIVDQINGLQKKHREEKRADIIEAMDEYLQHSPAARLLETFMVTTDKQSGNGRNLRDLTDAEETRLRAQLEGNFQANIVPGMLAEINSNSGDTHSINASNGEFQRDPSVQFAKNTFIEKPLAMAATQDHDHTHENNQEKGVSRARLREYLNQEFFLKRVGLAPTELANIHVVEESRGFKTIHIKDPNGEKRYDAGAWFYFVEEQMKALNDTSYDVPREYSRIAFQIIGLSLYDKTDTRDPNTIIAAGYHKAATVFADYVDQQYVPLHERSTHHYDHSIHGLLWLNNAATPLQDGEPVRNERIGYDSGFYTSSSSVEIDSAYELDKKQRWPAGTIKHISDDTLLEIPRIITKNYARNKDLPLVPTEHTDFVLESQTESIARSAGTGWTDSGDPEIPGMKLVARDGSTCYFTVDEEKDPYEPSPKELSYIQRRLVSDFCQEIGMTGLSEQIDSFDTLNIGQMVSLLRQNVRYFVPEANVSERNGIRDWKAYVREDGILEGQSLLFAQFATKVFGIMYPNPDWKDSIKSVSGFAVDNRKNVRDFSHWQTEIKLPREEIDIIIDISPPFTSLLDTAKDVEKIPPPPPPTVDLPRTETTRTYEYVDHRQELTVTSSKEFKELLNTTIGNILFAEPEVFAETKQRLFSKVPKNDDLPTYEALPPEVADAVVLGIANKGTDLADNDHDPAIAGMKLVAKDGDNYFYTIDPESTDYKPVLEPIPTQMRNELTVTCLKLKMAGLAEEIQTAENLTVEKLRQLVRRYSKYSIPEDGDKAFRADNIFDLKYNDMIDEDGILRGQCDTFEFFWRRLGRVFDGTSSFDQESGFSLRNTPRISKARHGQTRMKKDGVNALIDVDPLHYDIPDLDEETLLPDLETDDPIIIRNLTDEEIAKVVQDIQQDGMWPEELLSRPQKEREIDIDQKSLDKLAKALDDTIPPPVPQETPRKFDPLWDDVEFFMTPKGKIRKAMHKVRARMKRPFKQTWDIPPPPDVASFFTSPPITLPPPVTQKEVDREIARRVAEDPEYIQKAVAKRKKRAVSAPVTAPKAEIVADTTITIPEAKPEQEGQNDELLRIQEVQHIQSTNQLFLMGLSSYLGLRPGSHTRPQFIEHVIATNGKAVAERGTDIAERTLHLQVLSLVDKFQKIENDTFIETEYTDITKSLNRLQGIITMYKAKSPGFVRLLQQRKYPTYDQHFIDIMERSVKAYTAWNKSRKKSIVKFPTIQRDPKLDDDVYNNLFSDPHSTFDIPSQPKTIVPTPSQSHPNQELFSDTSYTDLFKNDESVFEYVTPPKKSVITPSHHHPEQETLSDPTYTDMFKDPSSEFDIQIPNKPIVQTPTQNHPEHEQLTNNAYNNQFTSDSDVEFQLAKASEPKKPTEHPQQDLLDDKAYSDQFKNPEK